MGGGAAVHQFVRIGTGSMVESAEISKDVGPHLLVMGRNRMWSEQSRIKKKKR